MNARTSSICILPAFLAIGLSFGCDPEPGPEPEQDRVLVVTDAEEAINEGEFGVSDNPVIAGIEGETDEGFIHFIEDPIAGVGIVASGRYAQHMSSLIDSEGASPLEVFLSVAPDESPPAELHENHNELADAGRVPDEPREFLAFRETFHQPLCIGEVNFNTWWPTWYPGYDDNAQNSGYLPSEDSFYVVTGASAQRALAICYYGIVGSTGNINLQFWNGTAWQIFYTQNGVARGDGVSYRSSHFYIGQYRERGWVNGALRNWYWGGAY
jgi:hypothetical protein